MLFIQTLFKDPTFGILCIIAVVFSTCCHEYAHARVALWQGDSTAADEGHLTLNPLKQMGPMSLVMLLFLGLAWGAVPVSKSRMRHPYSDALVSFAGPATNLLLALISGILFCVCLLAFSNTSLSSIAEIFRAAGLGGVLDTINSGQNPDQLPRGYIPLMFFQLMTTRNIALFILNMLPLPMLDGSHIFKYFFPNKINFNSELAKGAILLLFFLVFFTGNWLLKAGEYTLIGISWTFFKTISLAG